MRNSAFSFINPSGLVIGGVALAGGIAISAQPAPRRYIPAHPQTTAKKPVKNAARSVSQKSLAKATVQADKLTAKKAALPTPPAPPTFGRDVLPVVRKYCLSCHSGGDAAAGLALDKYKTVAAVLKEKTKWEHVAQNVAASHMPPAAMPQPTRQQRDRLTQWVEAALSGAEGDAQNPGRVTLRRLNREEYNNTIRDLFGIAFKPAADFPSDDIGYGFDNIGDVLSISPLLMEKYLSAAEKISMQAVVAPDADVRLARFGAEKLTPDKGANFSDDGGRNLNTEAEVGVDYSFPAAGEYVLRARAWAQQAGDEAARMALKLDGQELRVFDVTAVAGDSATYEHRLVVPAGRHRVTVTFTNDFYDEKLPEDKRDRNLIIDAIEIEGPRLIAPPLTPSHLKILPRPVTEAMTPQERANYTREILSRLARRAYRRPVTVQEVERLAGYVEAAQKEGDSFERGVQVAIQAMLVSPHFLFRIEREPDAKSGKNAKPAVRQLNDFEVASRLSYFLWSSTPDDTLLWWAEKGRLSEPQHLLHQVRRMLKDPKASALAGNFAVQWLELRRLSDVAPDPKLFPSFTPQLRAAMLTETTMFSEEIIRKDRSILDFLDAPFSYLNGPLAKHYGIAGVRGDKFARVVFSGDTAKRRGGILTHASVLTVTSNPTRTSPVKRGKWVLEEILGTPPPPPPPNVPDLSEDKAVITAATLRRRMEQHRKNPACSSCHARMDPIGFGLENYDAIGAWRTKEGKFPVDASGELAGGRKFNGAAQLKGILKGQKEQFTRALAGKMLTYALGRGLERSDKRAVEAIAQAAAADDYRFSSLVSAVVQSAPFRMKRADVTKK